MVWSAFALASALAVGCLVVADPRPSPSAFRTESARADGALGGRSLAASAPPSLAPRDAPAAKGRWTAIIVHDSGTPAGDLGSLDRRHARAGLAGLGFHFVVGNGQGIEDGRAVAGYRWDRQLPGAHATHRMALPVGGRTLGAAELNRTAIAVCIVGNMARRAPTERQVRETVSLVRELQSEYGIPAEAVRFRSELGQAGGDPGHFPLQEFRAGLRR